ncbi:hypothetical protein [Algoriphagus aquimarinus]|nr:hypothetical protein [Algoriphagus aquimarinus]
MSAIILLSSCQKHPSTIKFPEGLEELEIGENSKKLCIDCPKKFVGYLDLTQRDLFFLKMNSKGWKDLIVDYPELEVIWVFAGQSEHIEKTELVRLLEEMGYPYSVIYDKENKFFELNQLDKIPYEVKAIQSYFVDGDDVIIDAEPGIPNLFRKQVIEFLELEERE